MVVAPRAAVSWWDSFPCLHKPTASVFSLGENCGPVVGRVAGWECAKPPAAPFWLWDISQWPRVWCGSCTPTRCLCGTWRSSSSSALPVGGCGNPADTPLSKTPSTLQRAPHPGKGLNPQVLPLKVVATLEQGQCCWEMVPLGDGRGISGHAGAAPRSRSRGRSSAGRRHRCLAPSHGLSLSNFFTASPGKATGMKSNPSACVLACRVQRV